MIERARPAGEDTELRLVDDRAFAGDLSLHVYALKAHFRSIQTLPMFGELDVAYHGTYASSGVIAVPASNSVAAALDTFGDGLDSDCDGVQ